MYGYTFHITDPLCECRESFSISSTKEQWWIPFIASFLLTTISFWTNSRTASADLRDINLINDMKRKSIVIFLKNNLPRKVLKYSPSPACYVVILSSGPHKANGWVCHGTYGQCFLSGEYHMMWHGYSLSMAKWLHPLWIVWWNYISIPKRKRCRRWSLGMDEYFHLHFSGHVITYTCCY